MDADAGAPEEDGSEETWEVGASLLEGEEASSADRLEEDEAEEGQGTGATGWVHAARDTVNKAMAAERQQTFLKRIGQTPFYN